MKKNLHPARQPDCPHNPVRHFWEVITQEKYAETMACHCWRAWFAEHQPPWHIETDSSPTKWRDPWPGGYQLTLGYIPIIGTWVYSSYLEGSIGVWWDMVLSVRYLPRRISDCIVSDVLTGSIDRKEYCRQWKLWSVRQFNFFIHLVLG